jgi:choice-of-anchor A domain-containing protein
MMRLPVIAAVAVTTLSTVSAHALPLTASQILAGYNLVTEGNASTQSDIEGNAVIGGNFNGATVFNNHQPAHPEIDIYGTNLGNLNVNNGGTVHYGQNTGKFNLNGSGGSAVQGNFPYTLSSFTATLNQLSTQLEGLTSNSTVSTSNNTLTFNAAPGANGIAVFSFTAAALEADFSHVSNIAFSQNGAKSIIINVAGSFVEPSGANWNAPALQDVLFNFYDATTVTLNNWQASVLAPDAALNIASGNIQGFVYADTFGGGGELHNDPFTGSLPVSEPGAFAIFGLGLVGLIAARTAGVRRSIRPLA